MAELPGLREYDGYVNFLVPATLVTIALTAAMGSGAGLLGEIYSGFAGRLRCLPISLFAVLVARTIADSARLAVQLVITLGVSILLLEFRPAGGVPGVVAAALLTLFVGWCLSWVFVAVTTMVRRPETLQAVSFIVLFPLMFSSSAYMPIEAMPTWLRVLSTVNPVTYAVDATRALAFDRPWSSAVIAAVGISLVAAIAGAALAAKAVRR